MRIRLKLKLMSRILLLNILRGPNVESCRIVEYS